MTPASPTTAGLADWQRRFADAVAIGASPHDAATRALGIRRDLPAAARLAIYRGNITGARVHALAVVYAACQRVVGEACFGQLAADFARAHPSRAPDAGARGGDFAAWLTGPLRQPAFADLPWLADLARFEWARHSAAHAAEPPLFDWSAVTPDQARCATTRLDPTLRWIRSAYPVQALWRGDDTIEGLASPEAVAIWRRGAQVRAESIDGDTAAALDACAGGATLDALLAAGHAAAIPGLVERGWLAGLGVAR